MADEKIIDRTPHGQPLKIPTSQRQQIADAYAAGESANKLAEQHSVSVGTITKIVCSFGIPIRNREKHRKTSLTTEQKQAIVEAYKSGVRAHILSKQFGASPVTITSIAVKGGATRHPRWNKLVISEDERQQLIDRYLAGETQQEIATSLGTTRSYTQKLTSRRKVTRRRGPARTYTLDEGYFGDFDTPDAAVRARWLGLIASDGCIHDNDLIISLERGDREHLEAFAADIGSNRPIRDVELPCLGGGVSLQSRLEISSRQLTNDLRKCGIMECKSTVLKPWNGPDHLMRFWWGGMLDGDGTIVRADFRIWSLALYTGSDAIAQAFADYLGLMTGTERSIQRTTPTLFTVSIGGINLCVQATRLFYDDLHESVPLPRKLADAQRMFAEELATESPFSETQRNFDWSKYSVIDLERLRDEHGTWGKVASIFGVSVNTLHGRLARKRKAITE